MIDELKKGNDDSFSLVYNCCGKVFFCFKKKAGTAEDAQDLLQTYAGENDDMHTGIFPVPFTVLTTNPSLKQTPGY